MIVNMRDNGAFGRAVGNLESIGRAQSDADRFAVQAGAIMSRERQAAMGRALQSRKANVAARDGLIRNQNEALKATARIRNAGGDGAFSFDVDTFTRMGRELQERRPEEWARLMAPFEDLEEYEIDSARGAEMFTQAARLYEADLMERSAEIGARGFQGIQSLAGIEGAGLDDVEMLRIQGEMMDPSLTPQERELRIAEERQKIGNRIGLHAARKQVLTQADQVFGQAIRDAEAGGFGAAGLGGTDSRGAEVLELYGRIQTAETYEDLERARQQFTIKAMALDGVIAEAEQQAFRTGRESAQSAFDQARGQVTGPMDPAASEVQVPAGAFPSLGDGPMQMPAADAVVALDLERAGISLDSPQAEEFVAAKRMENPYYGMGPDEAAVQMIADTGLSDERAAEYQTFRASGMSSEESMRRVFSKHKAEVMVPNRMLALDIAPALTGLMSAMQGREVSMEEAVSAVENSGLLKSVMGSARALRNAAVTVDDRIDQMNGWLKDTAGAVGRTMTYLGSLGSVDTTDLPPVDGAFDDSLPAGDMLPFDPIAFPFRAEWEAAKTDEERRAVLEMVEAKKRERRGETSAGRPRRFDPAAPGGNPALRGGGML